MPFKKIYIEITNSCNLDCTFCIKNNRKREFISIDRFKELLPKLKDYTKYLYFHIMGEPLLHPNINELIDIASSHFKINITTNGYLIHKIVDNKNIHQINISLHSFDSKYNKTLDEYLDNIFQTVDNLLLINTIISFRLWTKNDYQREIIKKIEERYNCKIIGNTKIKENLYFEFDDEFIWPDVNNNYTNKEGSCMGLRTHIGILVDGTVVPCCLDSNGSLALGNIYKQSLNKILDSKKVQKIKIGFENNQKIEELCQHCNFYDRIKRPKGSDIREKR